MDRTASSVRSSAFRRSATWLHSLTYNRLKAELRKDKTDNFGNELVAAARRSDIVPSAMQKEVTVLNKLGLHARPASEFVRCAQTFRSEINIRRNNEIFSARSILEVLTANLDCGATMTLEAEGPDAELALEQLSNLMLEFKKQEEQEA